MHLMANKCDGTSREIQLVCLIIFQSECEVCVLSFLRAELQTSTQTELLGNHFSLIPQNKAGSSHSHALSH